MRISFLRTSPEAVELRHLRYFVAAAEELSLVRAARRLRVAQPALSKQIRNLETEVGVQLLERRARGVRLTAAGEAFLLEARRALECASRAVTRARAADDRCASQLTIGRAPFVVYAPKVAELLMAVRGTDASIDVQVVQLSDPELRSALRERRIDAAVTLVTSRVVPELNVVPLFDCSATGVLLPTSHPLAARPELALHELGELTYLYITSDHWPELARSHEIELRERGLVPRNRRPWSGPEVWQIAAGDGWTLANDAVAERYGSSTPEIAFRRFKDAPIPAWLALLWRPEESSPTMAKLLAAARCCAGEETEGPVQPA